MRMNRLHWICTISTRFFPAFMLMFFFTVAQSQSYCPNLDFSAGNFANWEGYYGDFYNPQAEYGFVWDTFNPRHMIIQSPGTKDFTTCNGLTTVAPGEAYSARLGNADVNAEAEELRYTYTVSSDNNLFIYKYAVVLEDPGHVPSHQPSFTIEVRNQEGTVFDPQCGYYYVYAQPGMPGWNSCRNSTGLDSTTVVWKDWTTVGLNLSDLVGQTITVVFTTRDCEEGGHFGYAYLSAHCSKLQLNVGFCVENSTVTVTAPPGFSYLWNTGETTQTISVEDPVPGMVDSCQLTSVNGCKVTIKALIQPTILHADFNYKPECSEDPIAFSDTSTINQNAVVDWKWDFGDGTPEVVHTPKPFHAFKDPGSYDVTMVSFSTEGCSDTVVKTITILPKIKVDLGNDVNVHWSQTIDLDAGNPGSTYLWSTGATTQSVTVGGSQTVWVSVVNDNCSATDTIKIHEYPRCLMDVPNAFSPNGDGQNDKLYVYGGGFYDFEFLIFDRSGEQVFSTRDQNEGWDGTYKGQPLGTGVYNYILRGSCIDGDPVFKKGNITLLK